MKNLENILDKPARPIVLYAMPIIIGVLRVVLDHLLAQQPFLLNGLLVLQVEKWIAFYFFMLCGIRYIFFLLTGKRADYVLITALLFGLWPPFLDFAAGTLVHQYTFKIGLTLFNTVPTIGELITIYMAILTFGAVVFISEKNPKKTILSIISIYLLFRLAIFILALPTLKCVKAILQNNAANLLSFTTALLLIGAGIFILAEERELRGLIKYRFSRLYLLFCCLVFAMFLYGKWRPSYVIAAITIYYTFMLFYAIESPLHEYENRLARRPVFKFPDYVIWYFVFTLIMLFVVNTVIDNNITLLLIITLVGLFGYIGGVQLKDIFPLGNITEGIIYSMILFYFYPNILFFVVNVFIFTVGSIAKDYKDWQGDLKAGIKTFFTLPFELSVKKRWQAISLALVVGPILYTMLVIKHMNPFMLVVDALFVIASSYILMLHPTRKKEKMFNTYLYIFATYLLIISILFIPFIMYLPCSHTIKVI